MTIWDMLRAGARFWPATVIGAILTLGAGIHVVGAPNTYWGQLNIIFLTPESDQVPNSFTGTQASAIMIAGVIQREIADDLGAPVVSDEVTIVGQGIRNGSWVRLPNSGGQWANNFDRPMLDVQAVAPKPGGVIRQLEAITSQVDAALQRRQDMAGVAANKRFTTVTNPRSVVVRQGEGNRPLALVVTVLLGLSLTITAVSMLETRSRRPLPTRAEGAKPQLGSAPELGDGSRPRQLRKSALRGEADANASPSSSDD